MDRKVAAPMRCAAILAWECIEPLLNAEILLSDHWIRCAVRKRFASSHSFRKTMPLRYSGSTCTSKSHADFPRGMGTYRHRTSSSRYEPNVSHRKPTSVPDFIAARHTAP